MPLQRDLHDQLRRDARTSHDRLASIVRPLDPERLVRRPQPGAWSVGEILEHLCVADELYEKPLTKLIRGARPDAAAPLREWKPSFLGKIIANALTSPKPSRTMRSMAPRTPRNGVLEDFLGRDTRLMQRMDDCASLDWHALRIGSPALPPVPWFLKLNLGDVFNIHVIHVQRHLGQIERAIGAMKQ